MMQVKVDTSDLERVFKESFETMPDQAKRAFHRAAKETEKHAQMVIAKQVASAYTIKAADVKNPKTARVSVTRSNGGLTLRYTGRPLTLHHFKYTPKAKSRRGSPRVRAANKKTGLKSLGSHAFIGGTGALNPGKVASIPFMREGKKRLPIKAVYGPSVPQMIGNEEDVESVVIPDLNEYIFDRFKHHMDWYSKEGGK